MIRGAIKSLALFAGSYLMRRAGLDTRRLVGDARRTIEQDDALARLRAIGADDADICEAFGLVLHGWTWKDAAEAICEKLTAGPIGPWTLDDLEHRLRGRGYDVEVFNPAYAKVFHVLAINGGKAFAWIEDREGEIVVDPGVNATNVEAGIFGMQPSSWWGSKDSQRVASNVAVAVALVADALGAD